MKKKVSFSEILQRFSRKSCNTLLVTWGHLAIWESAKSMSHGGGFGEFPVVKRGHKRGHYVYAKRQGRNNTEPGIVTNIGVS